MKSLAKKIIFFLADASGLPRLNLLFGGADASVILYHGVAPAFEDGIFNYRQKFIPPEVFRRQIKWLKAHYTILPLPVLIKLLAKDEKFPRRTMTITFDDGYENFFRFGFPILKECGVPATMFIATDLVEKRDILWFDRLEYAVGHNTRKSINFTINGKEIILPTHSRKDKIRADNFLREHLKKLSDHERMKSLDTVIARLGAPPPPPNYELYRGLTFAQLQEMERSGITFAPHTKSHPILSKLTRDEAEKEVNESYTVLTNHLSDTIKVFAYPNGQKEDYSAETIDILQKNAFLAAFTTIPGKISRKNDIFRIPRFVLDGTNEMRMFRLKVSGIHAALQYARSLFSAETKLVSAFFEETANSYLAEYQKDTPEGFSFRERKNIALEMLGGITGQRILDIGSGPGIIIEELLRGGATVTAVDIAPAMIALISQRFHHPNLETKVGDIEHLESPQNSFDRILALGVLEYLEADRLAMNELQRVLKNDGEAIISFPNRKSPWRTWNRILLTIFRLPWRLLQRLCGRHPHPIRHREYAKREIAHMAEMHGFEVKDFAGYNFKLMPFPLDRLFPGLTVRLARRLNHLSRTRFNWLATGYLVRMRRLSGAAKN